MNFTDRANLESSTRRITDEGYMHCIADTCRTGIYEYTAAQVGMKDREPGETVKVYRAPEEVFNDAAMASFKGKPVTFSHPDENVTAKNIRDYTVGHGGDNVFRDGDTMKQNLYITDEAIINLIDSGEVDQISNGYTAEIVIADGVTPEGERYDAFQKTIKGNHIAIVKNGRAGSGCRINDSQETPNKQGGNKMPTMKFNDVEIEVTDAAKQAIEKQQGEIQALKDSAEAHEGVVASLKDEHSKEIAKLEAERDDAKAKILTDEQIEGKIEVRTALIADAKLVDADFGDGKGMSNEAIISSVVCKDNEDLQDKSADYKQARFDMMLEDAKVGSEHKSNKVDMSDAAANDGMSPSEVARAKFIADSEEAYKA